MINKLLDIVAWILNHTVASQWVEDKLHEWQTSPPSKREWQKCRPKEITKQRWEVIRKSFWKEITEEELIIIRKDTPILNGCILF